MGCGSSKQAQPETTAVRPTSAVPPNSSNNAAAITSQTAINPPASPSTSRHRPQGGPYGPGASASSLSTPRTSTTGRHGQDNEASLTEHYNVPLTVPKVWTTTERAWSRLQLQREREDFFETRVTGKPEIWAALKATTELIRQGDIVEAQAILNAADITLPTGRLEEGAYDQRGMLYRLPENIITDPLNLIDDDGETVIGEPALDKNLELALCEPATAQNDGAFEEKPDKGKDVIEKDAMKVKCRLSDRGGPDVVVLLGQTQPVSALVRRLRSEASLPSSAKVKCAYFGKILSENKTLEEQGWQQGHVVQALVSNFGP